jgi:hypothetical protein
VGGGLWFAVAGEHPFAVAAHAHDPWCGGEVGEVSHVLSHDCLDPVEDPVGHLQQLGAAPGTLTNPTGREGSQRRASAASGSK